MRADGKSESGWAARIARLLRLAAATLLVAGIGSTALGAPPNYQGLWWKSPAGSESGWGINFAHQGDIIFATWFTYDADGKPWWLIAELHEGAGGSFSGPVSTVTGPAYNAAPFDSKLVAESIVGSMTATFSDAKSGSITYTVNGVTQTKAIAPQEFGPLPTCAWGADANLAAATNYTDLWWNPAEAGWGINLTHQGDIVFATWFTYDGQGKPWWLIAELHKSGAGVYTGGVSTVTGPPFSAVPFDPGQVKEASAGTATLSFAHGNSATFAYTVAGAAQSKAIERQVFRAPGTLCQAAAPAAGTAEGRWRGTSSSGKVIDVVVLEDGSYYLAYSNASPTGVAGAIYGPSTSANGTFTAGYSYHVVYRIEIAGGSTKVTGTYVPRNSLQLTIGEGVSAETVALAYDASYDQPASVTALAGSWKGTQGHNADPWLMTATFDAAGKLAMSGACPFTGSAVPHGSTGIFDLTVKTVNGPCLGGAGRTAKGILIVDGATGQILGLAPFNGDALFIGAARQ